jgi:hypothetical protein
LSSEIEAHFGEIARARSAGVVMLGIGDRKDKKQPLNPTSDKKPAEVTA